MKTKIVSYHTADSKAFKQEVNGTVTLPPLEFPGQSYPGTCLKFCSMRLETSNTHYIKLKKNCHATSLAERRRRDDIQNNDTKNNDTRC